MLMLQERLHQQLQICMVILLLNYQHGIFLLTTCVITTILVFHLRGGCISPGHIKFLEVLAMKEIAGKPIPSVPAESTLAAMHSSYRSAAIKASAALHNLTTQFRLKNERRPRRTGRA
jgi:hypothetical protein